MVEKNEYMDTQKWIDEGYNVLIEFAPKVLAALAIWIIGGMASKLLLIGFKRLMERREYDKSFQKFLVNLTRWTLTLILIVVVLTTLGVATTSFGAILASVGLAIGLALQGSLSNFAGGVLIMLFKPIKIGDLIEAQGEIGSVKEI